MTLKLGRKPAVHTAKTMRSALVLAKALDPLGAPPPECNAYLPALAHALGLYGTDIDLGMMGNDSVGDCTIADSCHQIMLHTANTGTFIQPTTQDAIDAYTAATGYNPADPNTDQGADETSICQFMISTGICGQKSNATGMVDPQNEEHVKWATLLFGSLRLGVNLPQSAMDQFNSNQPWDVSGDATILGGHDVPIVDYRGGLYYIVSWGKLVPMTPAFLKAYVVEAHGEVWADWTTKQGSTPANLNLAQLVAELRAVA
jgi:hypothetical protein